jgi:CheY-like chemotaxis protein
MTGLDLHDRLVAAGKAIPTIVITAFPKDADRARALQAGVVFGSIVKVDIVGLYTGTQWLLTQPTEQFMIVSVQDRGA